MTCSNGWQGFWTGEIFDDCLYFEVEGQEGQGDGRAAAAVVALRRRLHPQKTTSNFARL